MAEGGGERVLVLYGSQTGNAADIAQALGADIAPYALAEVMSMKEWMEAHAGKVEALKTCQASFLILVVSTTGNGDPPDNAAKFYRRFRMVKEPNWLPGLKFALLGLGDSNYDQFCHMGKQFLKMITKAGGLPFVDSAFADEAVGLDLIVEPWKKSVKSFFKNLAPRKSVNLSASEADFIEEKIGERRETIDVAVVHCGDPDETLDLCRNVVTELLRHSAVGKINMYSMAEYVGQHAIEDLSSINVLVLIANSSHSDEIPENGIKFIRKLKLCKVDKLLHGCMFASVGIFQSSSSGRSHPVILATQHLERLGSRSLLPLCRLEDDCDIVGEFEAWKSGLIQQIEGLFAPSSITAPSSVSASPSVSSDVFNGCTFGNVSEEKSIPKWRPSRIKVVQIEDPDPSLSATPRWKVGINNTETILRGYTPDAPFLSRIQRANFLTSPGASKHVLHLEIDVPF